MNVKPCEEESGKELVMAVRRQTVWPHWRLLLAVLTMATAGFVWGCTCRTEDAPPAPPAASTAPETPAGAAPAPEAVDAWAEAKMRVVGLDGQPLSGMIPIATLQPNAFDEPLAKGPATGPDGESSIRIPADQKLALRAWDPELRYFPNNYYEVLPNAGVLQETLVVSMVAAARIDAVLVMPDGRPARQENAGLMLFHSVHGPWWPAQADANEMGEVRFAPVPPGKYVMRIKVASGPMLELPETFVAPDGDLHLGMVYLQ